MYCNQVHVTGMNPLLKFFGQHDGNKDKIFFAKIWFIK